MEPPDGLAAEMSLAWREHWPYFKLAAGLFVVGTLLGVILAILDIDLLGALGFEELGDALPEELTTLAILLNNSIVFVLALLGVLTFGLLTAVIVVFNGLLVGFVVTPALEEAGIGFVVVAIVPHGVLELPAFFAAAAVAFRLLHRFVQRIRDRRDTLVSADERRRIGLYLVVAWIALAVAAVIEIHVSFRLVETLFEHGAAIDLD